MQRPTGVTVLSILYILGGAIHLVTSCLALVGGSQLISQAEGSDRASSELASDFAFCGILASWIGLTGTGASLLSIGTGTGLWMLRPWGWWIALFRVTAKLATHLLAVSRGARSSSHVGGIVVNMVVLAYLSRPSVRQALSGAPIDVELAPH